MSKRLEYRTEPDMWQKYAVLQLWQNMNILHHLSMQPPNGSQVKLNMP